ncbi:TBC1 domain family member 25 isoform X2 [Bacillus rossius redtenbacheri]|uniref:TBC1 domain family member 25 isoform X2 n=1 Tax=Bacillus rossius redtenbacheri TaxID=93214 RepID=UPI002FDDEB1C
MVKATPKHGRIIGKCEGILQPEFRKFSVDPQITSFEVLQSILAKAFDIKGEFTVCYKAYDDYGQETYLSLLSDWDLDAAFLSASEPCLCLQVDLRPFEETSEDWDSVGYVDAPRPPAVETRLLQNRLPGLILNQVERTFNMVQRALSLVEEGPGAVSCQPPRSPLSDAEFRRFLDPVGQVTRARELRSVIYLGGIDPSLRKVVWKHILNVYPEGMSGKERMDYMKRKSYEYQALRDKWRDEVQQSHGQVTGDLAYVTSMVRKDVLRTDRHHKFYAGSDDNQNIASLFNILTTYALNHPTVSYCQGMSDLASPLLVTMGDEAHAYICFCALMRRLRPNFLLDGITMTLKFQHLAEAIMFYDPEFYAYLKSHQADDLLFCYRWLLLEMKREFAFEDALRMLEVLWSSLPQMSPQGDLPLFEKPLPPQPQGEAPAAVSPAVKSLRENAYTKVCALRRQSSSASLHSIASLAGRKSPYRQNQSLDETTIGRIVSKEQRRAKLFASMDDASMRTAGRDASANRANDDATRINNHINKTEFRPASLVISDAAELTTGPDERFDDADTMPSDTADTPTQKENLPTRKSPEKQQPRVVKNLNEFLNFTGSDKLKLRDKLLPNMSLKKELNLLENEKTIAELPEKNGDDAPTEARRADEGDASSPDDSAEYFPVTTSMTRELRLELESLDRQVFGPAFPQRCDEPESPRSESPGQRCDCVLSKHDSELPSDETTTEVAEACSEPRPGRKLDRRSRQCSPALTLGAGGDEVFVWENPLRCPATPDEQADLEYDEDGAAGAGEGRCDSPGPGPAGSPEDSWGGAPPVDPAMTTSCEEVTERQAPGPPCLPAPHQLGGGNPFLMFLCVTLLLQHRDHVMRSAMDYNEMAMHFDKMVRKHDVTRVLDQARRMFRDYLQQQSPLNNNAPPLG